MPAPRTADHHERLMNRMAGRAGVDLDLAQQVGLFSYDDYADAVVACVGCSATCACETHLEEGASGVPDFCRNAGTLARLADEMEVLGLSED